MPESSTPSSADDAVSGDTASPQQPLISPQSSGQRLDIFDRFFAFLRQDKDTVIHRERDGVTRYTYQELINSGHYAGFAEMATCARLSELVYDLHHPDQPKTPDELINQPPGWRSYQHNVRVPPDHTSRKTIKGFAWHVWENPSKRKVVIAFRGTEEISDWYANLRVITRFIPFVRDHYEQALGLVPPLVQHIRNHYDNDVEIIATGHSLGGGLATLAGYKSAFINRVLAYAPSPVTGNFTMARHLNKCDRQSLWIGRVFENREILAHVRFLVRRFVPLSRNNPKIEELKFDFDPSRHPTREHSIQRLAQNLNITFGQD